MARRPDKFPLKISEGNVSVSIYRQDRTAQGKGITYIVADRSSGSRRLQSFADLDKAKLEAARLARLLATGQTHAAAFSNEDAASFGRAVTLLAESGAGLELACSIFAEGVRIVGKPSTILDACRLYQETHAGVTAKPVSEAVTEYIGVKEAQGASHRYRQDLSHRLGRLADAFLVPVDGVQTSAIQKWLDALKASPQTTRNFRTVLSGFFSFCRSRGWCASNPADGLTVPRLKTDSEPEVFTPEEFEKLLSAASPDFLPCLVLGGFCGLRSAEIERLHWEDVRLPAGEVVIKRGTAKTKSRRIVPIPDTAKAWLAPYANNAGAIWTRTHEDFYQAQADTAKAAGIVWKPNGLRHGYATHRLAETGDAVRVAHEMGNSAGVVHSHYKSLVSEADGKAWFGIHPNRPGNVVTVDTRNPKTVAREASTA
ncbi:MAG: tyrosine-type recombinase/integrase [Limisphaerales bacterium]